MSIKDKIFGTKKGEQCVQNEDGSITCRRFKREGNDELTDGTELSFGIDPQTCKPIFTGPRKVMDGDQDWAKSVVQREIEACKRGLA